MATKPALTTEQIKAAMDAMLAKANETPDAPVAMAIVDAGGELLAYFTMENLRVFSRRHARRKAYTSAIIGRDSGEHAAGLAAQGRGIADMGDPGRAGHHEGRRDSGRHRRGRLPQRPGRRRPVASGPGGDEPVIARQKPNAAWMNRMFGIMDSVSVSRPSCLSMTIEPRR